MQKRIVKMESNLIVNSLESFWICKNRSWIESKTYESWNDSLSTQRFTALMITKSAVIWSISKSYSKKYF